MSDIVKAEVKLFCSSCHSQIDENEYVVITKHDLICMTCNNKIVESFLEEQ